MPARLNIFQRTMLQWNDLHPYNAIHVVRIPAPLEAGRLTQAITGTLVRLGLTNLMLQRKPGTYRYHGGPVETEIKWLPAGGDVGATLATEIEAQLNRGFDYAGGFNPFRWFVAPETAGFFLGVVYFHAVADAESLVHLLRRIVKAYRAERLDDDPAIEIHPPRKDYLACQHPSVLVRKLIQLPAQVRNLRSSCRVPHRDVGDGHTGFTALSLAPAELQQLVATAKVVKVTVNDVLLALLLQCVAALAPDRSRTTKRRKLSVGCIVNTRKDLGLDGPRTFGLFLGSFIVTHEVPPGIGLVELARAIQSQTAAIKRQQLYLGAALEMAIAGSLLSFYSTPRRKKLYQKNYPLWGGVTNMNLNLLWPQPDAEPAVHYFRAVSTGPVTPLVLSATTMGEAMNIGLTYRTTVFSAAAMDSFRQSFLSSVCGLTSSS